jgi:pimeloyl-ACP methyl ester carboxylesterase
VSADVIREICDYVAASRALRPLADAGRPYLVGHSRGGKLSVLAAARDAAAGVARVGALGLVDPVNNTAYAPQSPRFPSATAALRSGGLLARGPPLLAVGAGRAADCAPRDANYRTFFDAAPGAAWEVCVADAGHFQFLDAQTGLQRAVCATGKTEDGAVRDAAAGALVAWGRAALFGRKGGEDADAAAASVSALLDAAEADVAAVLGGGQGAVAARRKGVRGALAEWAD